jgi:hypothetical protein
MDEKIYYNAENVKVSNLRITCDHITIPISKIDRVITDFKVFNLVMSAASFGIFLIVIAVCCYFYDNWGYLGIIPLMGSFVWYRMVYRKYVELRISTGAREIRILEAPMNNRDTVYKVEEALNAALIEYVSEKELSGKTTASFSPSETVILKKILLEYDGNKK